MCYDCITVWGGKVAEVDTDERMILMKIHQRINHVYKMTLGHKNKYLNAMRRNSLLNTLTFIKKKTVQNYCILYIYSQNILYNIIYF